MINQFLKIAGVTNKNDFYKMYPTEEAFFNAHPEARKMADGGMMQSSSQGGEDQQKQIVMQIAQALQQGAQPEQVMEQLVQMGMPQNQAMQIVQAVAQQMQGGGLSQQPGMAYGGALPYAAEGMSFGTGNIATMPNVKNFPSYDAYNQAYNNYLSSIDTTTTEAPYDPNNPPDMSVTLSEDALNDPDLQKIAKTPILDSNAAINNMDIYNRKNLTPETAPRPETGSSWKIPTVIGATVAGTLIGRKVLPGTGKWLKEKTWDKGKLKWGDIPEIDKSKLSPEVLKALEGQLDVLKREIANRGYTVGKEDINKLVSRGMSKTDAAEFVKVLPTKDVYEKNIKQATKGKTDTPATTSTETPPAVNPMDEEIGKLMDHEYYKNALTDPNLESSKRVDYELRVKDPETWLKNQINTWTDTYQTAIKNGNAGGEQSAKRYIDSYNAQLDELRNIKSKYSTGTPAAASSTPATTSTPAAATSTPATTPSATSAKVQETKAAIKAKRDAPVVTKSKTAIATENEANKIISEMIRTGKRSAAQMDRLNQLGMDDISIMRKIKGKKVVATNPMEFAARNKYITSGIDKAANITKILEEIRIAKEAGKLREVGELTEALRLLREVPKQYGGEYAFGGYVPEYAAQSYGGYELPQFEMGSYYEEGGAWTGTWNGNQGFAYGGSNPFEDNPLRRFVYADGGMSPEEAAMMEQQQGAPGGDEMDAQMQKIVEIVVNMLEQGMAPDQIIQQLVQAGLPQEMAQQVVQHVIEQSQGGDMAQQQGEQQMMPPQEMPQQGGGAPEEQGGAPAEQQAQEMPMQRYGGRIMANGGSGDPMFYPTVPATPIPQNYNTAPYNLEHFTQYVPMYKNTYGIPRINQGDIYDDFKANLMKKGIPAQEAANIAMFMNQYYTTEGELKQVPFSNPYYEAPVDPNFKSMDDPERQKEILRKAKVMTQGLIPGKDYKYGGQPQVGEEMDVTPEQLEELKRQGIKFKIIK